MQLHSDIKTSISGIRGHYPSQLDLASALGLVESFINTLPSTGPIVIGRDMREGSVEIYNHAISMMQELGIEVFDIELLPLPTTGIAVRNFKAVGGINVTASHNPLPFCGLKFLDESGEFIGEIRLDELLQNFADLKSSDVIMPISSSQNHKSENHNQAMTGHLSLFPNANFNLTIAIDALNASASEILPKLVERLGCQPVLLACNPNDLPPREFEPNTKNLAWTTEKIQSLDETVDFAVAVDPDADRLVVLLPSGEVLSEEYTLALATWGMLETGYKGNVVANLSTSSLVDWVAKKYNRQVLRSPVGERNVVALMKESDSIIGGEGNGGVIDGTIHYSRDSLSALYHIANLINATGKTLFELIQEIPPRVMVKEKIILDPMVKATDLFAVIINYYKDDSAVKNIDQQDGLRIDLANGDWVQLRASNTEPILRLFSESNTKQDAEALRNNITNII